MGGVKGEGVEKEIMRLGRGGSTKEETGKIAGRKVRVHASSPTPIELGLNPGAMVHYFVCLCGGILFKNIYLFVLL